MSIAADTHLFGSEQGYRTLSQSVGVSTAERDELSVFGFGQTNDQAFLDGLATEPSAYGRQLASGRFAITRCLKGPLDDAGRPSLLLCTILISHREYSQLAKGDLDSLIRDQDVWEASRFESGEKIPVRLTCDQSNRADRRDDLSILDAWLTARSDPGTVSALPHTDDAAHAILSLPQILSHQDRPSFRWGVRLLSADVPVDVCTLAQASSRPGRRKIHCSALGGPMRNEVTDFLLRNYEAGNLHELPSLASLLHPDPETPTILEQMQLAAKTSEPHAAIHRRRILPAALFVSVLVMASVVLLLVTQRANTPPPTEDSDAVAAESDVGAVDSAVVVSSKQETREEPNRYWIEKYKELVVEVQTLPAEPEPQLNASNQTPNEQLPLVMPQRIEELEQQLEDIRDDLDESIPDAEGLPTFAELHQRLEIVHHLAVDRARAVADRYCALLARKVKALDDTSADWTPEDENELEVLEEILPSLRAWGSVDNEVHSLLADAETYKILLTATETSEPAVSSEASAESDVEEERQDTFTADSEDDTSTGGGGRGRIHESAETTEKDIEGTLEDSEEEEPPESADGLSYTMSIDELVSWFDDHALQRPEAEKENTSSDAEYTLQRLPSYVKAMDVVLWRIKISNNPTDLSESERLERNALKRIMEALFHELTSVMIGLIDHIKTRLQKTLRHDNDSLEVIQEKLALAQSLKENATQCHNCITVVIRYYNLIQSDMPTELRKSVDKWKRDLGTGERFKPGIRTKINRRIGELEGRIEKLQKPEEDKSDDEQSDP